MALADTDSTGSQDFVHKKRSLTVVGGPEWTLGDATLGVELMGQRVFDFASPDTVLDPVGREIAWRQAALGNQRGLANMVSCSGPQDAGFKTNC